MKATLIDALVHRFLAWPLPSGVCPDACTLMRDYPHPLSGANLLSAGETREMLDYVVGPQLERIAALEAENAALKKDAEPALTISGANSLGLPVGAKLYYHPPVEPCAARPETRIIEAFCTCGKKMVISAPNLTTHPLEAAALSAKPY